MMMQKTIRCKLKLTLFIYLCCVTSEPSSLIKNLPAVSKATKRSFMERPPSPERPRYSQFSSRIYYFACV